MSNADQDRENAAMQTVRRAQEQRDRDREGSFDTAYAAARRDWLKGGNPTFSWNGKSYSVASREEAAANKERRESANTGRGMNRAEAPARAATRSTASAALADRAAKDASAARAASEARAANPYNDRSRRQDTESNARAVSRGESTSGMGSKITNRPKEGAKSIYADLDAGKVAGAAATIAAATRMGRLAKGAIEAGRAAAAKKAGSEIVRDADRVNFANGGLVRRATAKSHGKAC